MNISISKHAAKRMRERNISEIMVSAAINFGERIYAKNSLYYFLGKKAVSKMQQLFLPDNPDKWQGVVIVCDSKSGTMLTCFKNKNWLKRIRHH
ncbi:MAG: DUF4258 domain-containing protein [Calditrichaceae bacterium]